VTLAGPTSICCKTLYAFALYQWWVLLHIVGVAGFLATHGVSMFVLYRVRAVSGNRDRIADLISLSRASVTPMYVFFLMLLVGGVVAGVQGDWFNDWWIWEAIVVLLLATGAMYGLAKPHMDRLLEACTVRPSGVPRVSDEELNELLSSPRTTLVTAIGAGALLVILYLMIFKPGIRF
jgi:cytochrome bd-type quinol oxidase subunit 2